MTVNKWIPELTADLPVADAARLALTLRFDTVRHFLPLALQEAEKDVEHIHQLRVSTRRARACLDIFADCLPKKVYRSARKQLRTLRRLAGAARDWDVFLADLRARPRPKQVSWRPGVDFLLGYGLARRHEAQVPLDAAGKCVPEEFAVAAARTVATVSAPEQRKPRTLGDLAGPLVSSLLQDLSDAANDGLNEYDQLHAVRIVGKRLRYGIEILGECLDSDFKRRVYPMIEEMQEVLGSINDNHLACERLSLVSSTLAAWKGDAARLLPGVAAALRSHQRSLARERKRFLKLWKQWQEKGVAAAS